MFLLTPMFLTYVPHDPYVPHASQEAKASALRKAALQSVQNVFASRVPISIQ